MSVSVEELKIRLNSEQREYLFSELISPVQEKMAEDMDELGQLILTGVKRHVRKSPLYEAMQRIGMNKFKSFCNFHIPFDVLATREMRKSVRENLRKKHPTWVIQDNEYTYPIWRVRSEVKSEERIPEFQDIMEFFHSSKRPKDVIESIFEPEEIVRIDTLVEEIYSLLIIGVESYSEHRLSYGGHFGAIKTWGELYKIDPEWFNIVRSRFIDSPEVVKFLEAHKDKKAKVEEINNVLMELKQLAKHCNVIS